MAFDEEGQAETAQLVPFAGTIARLNESRRAFEPVDHARVAGELNAANRIQTRMLPDPAVVLANEKRIEIFSHMRPAREVGGDL